MRLQVLIGMMEHALGKQEGECYNCKERKTLGGCFTCPGMGTKRVLKWLLREAKNG